MSDQRPLAVDLFCGRGGWTKGLLAAGFRVVGLDVDPQPAYPQEAEFRQADIRDVNGAEFQGAAVVSASPPCTGFSSINFLNANRRVSRPRPQDFELVAHALRLIGEIGPRFWAMENVAGAVSWFEPMLGLPRLRAKPYYLWGHFPGFLLPTSARLHVKMKAVGVARNGREAVGRQWVKEKYGRKPWGSGGPWDAKREGMSALVAEISPRLALPFAQACMDALTEEVPA